MEGLVATTPPIPLLRVRWSTVEPRGRAHCWSTGAADKTVILSTARPPGAANSWKDGGIKKPVILSTATPRGGAYSCNDKARQFLSF
jgi:hypothetical protein